MPSASRLSRQLSLLEVRIIHLLDKADINELQTGGNPAFRIYDVDPDTYEIMDSLTYFSKSLTIILGWYSMNFIGDMSDPNYQITRGCSRSIIHFIWRLPFLLTATWELYYSARQTYGPLVDLSPTQSLNAAFWHNVTEVFATNDTAFQLYNTFMTRGGKVIPCEGSCQSAAICDMRAMRAENNCVRYCFCYNYFIFGWCRCFVRLLRLLGCRWSEMGKSSRHMLDTTQENARVRTLGTYFRVLLLAHRRVMYVRLD